MNDVERIARAIEGPHKQVSATCKWTLTQLREVRWSMLSKQEQGMRLIEAKAAIAEMQIMIDEYAP